MILLTPLLGSRNYFFPESNFIPDDRLLSQKPSKILSDVRSRTCVHHFCVSLPPSTPMENYIHLPFIQSFLDALVITRCPKILYCFENPLSLLPCSSLPHEYPPSNNSLHSPRISSSSVVRVIHKVLRNTIWSSENPLQPVALGILAYLLSG